MEYNVGIRVFDDWTITREIGSGASGRVWEIVKTDHDISTLSALKIIQVPQNPLLEKCLYNDGMDEISVKQFFQGVVNELIDEIKIMIDMKGYPYIVNCEDYKVIEYPDEVKWDILIRMELLTPVQTYIQNNVLSEADILKMGKELLQTLILFESRGIIHRDIKPDNILIDKYGNFKIGDFGIARICDKASVDLSKKGTENYMAPEVYYGKDYDHTVDVYSLGLVLYKFLNNNRLPFYPGKGAYSDWDAQQALNDRLGGKKELPLPCSASPELGKIISRMCAHNPKERYQKAEEILADLEHVTGSAKGIIGSSREVANPTNGTGNSFDETRAFFESGMVIHDAAVIKKTSKTGITGNSSTKASSKALVKEDKSEKKEIKSQEAEEQDSAKGTTDIKNHESTKKGTIKKKSIIQGLSITVIIAAVMLYFLMSRNYSLSVTDGSGTGTYKGGEKVTVTAKDVFGSTFVKWDVTGKLVLTDKEVSSKTISFKMPRHEISLKAVYNINNHKVVINSGSGTGQYNVGDEVTVAADEPEEGMEFSEWDVESDSVQLQHADKRNTSFIMPDDDVEISAVYKSLQYSLQVEDGQGSGNYEYNKTVRITAQEKSGQTFSEWVVIEGDLVLAEDERSMPELTINMPPCDVIMEAKYKTNQHEVIVNGGSGSGNYEVGEEVTITADTAGIGKIFSGWELESGFVSLQNEQKEQTSFNMPDDDVEISAAYKNLQYSLQVEDGQGSGNYEYNKTVRITAEEKSGQTFSEWVVIEGDLVLAEDERSMPELTINMPPCDVIMEAKYKANQHEVIVNGGSGSGNYEVGEKVTITADTADSGEEFSGWEFEEGSVSLPEPQKAKISFDMPDEKLVINAVFKDIEYNVSVNGGSGSGTYHYGDRIQVSAKESSDNIPFSHWSIDKGTIKIKDLTVKNLTFEMPAEEIVMTAHYSQPKFTLKVEDGKGSGMYDAGSTVTIKADAVNKAGIPFGRWEVISGSLKLEDEKKSELSFEMPSEKIVIKAVYEAKDAYSVLVFGGSGAGIYAEGDTVTVTAEKTPGKKFNCWFITAEGSQSVENDNESFSFSMPATDLIITAMYDLE